MLAQTLKEARLKRGFSVGQLSKRSGVPGWVISNIEGESPSSYVPSEGNVALLGETLRVPVGPLLVEKERLLERAYPPPRSPAEGFPRRFSPLARRREVPHARPRMGLPGKPHLALAVGLPHVARAGADQDASFGVLEAPALLEARAREVPVDHEGSGGVYGVGHGVFSYHPSIEAKAAAGGYYTFGSIGAAGHTAATRASQLLSQSTAR
jgi:transcriptional regulator with XRE-family HTH domain